MTLPIVPNAYGFDRSLAALFCHALNGETVSMQAAKAQLAGKRWGCILCRTLDVLIERGHCAAALSSDGPTRGQAAIRSGLVLLFGAAIPFSLACWAGWAAVFAVLRWLF